MKMQRVAMGFFLWMCTSASAGERNAAAEDRNPELGVGSKPCSDWTEIRGLPGQQQEKFQEWVLGFVSAFADKKKFGQAEIFEWTDSFCRANPSDPIYTASRQFVWTKVPVTDHPLQP